MTKKQIKEVARSARSSIKQQYSIVSANDPYRRGKLDGIAMLERLLLSVDKE